MIDSLNAEIALGTVANINDAVQWLGFTYMFVRMKKNPFVYGQSVHFQPLHSLTIIFSRNRQRYFSRRSRISG